MLRPWSARLSKSCDCMTSAAVTIIIYLLIFYKNAGTACLAEYLDKNNEACFSGAEVTRVERGGEVTCGLCAALGHLLLLLTSPGAEYNMPYSRPHIQ